MVPPANGDVGCVELGHPLRDSVIEMESVTRTHGALVVQDEIRAGVAHFAQRAGGVLYDGNPIAWVMRQGQDV